MRSYLIWPAWCDEGQGGVYLAETAGKAKYDALLSMGDSYTDLTFSDLRCRRIPAYDGSREEWNGHGVEAVAEHLSEEAEVREWNASHPIGTPVVVRLDGGGEMHTRTRSAASILCYRAVVWCEGIAGCYALSHITAEAAP